MIDTTPITTCQICARPIKSKSGTIAHHGYTRKRHGWQTASCAGTHHRPYEISCDALPPTIARVEQWVAKRRAWLDDFTANPPETLTFTKYRATTSTVVARPADFLASRGRDRSIPYTYANQYGMLASEATHDIERGEQDLAVLRQRLADWKAPITVHLNADATLRPETAAALDTLIQIAVEAMETDSVVFDEDIDTPAIVAAEHAPDAAADDDELSFEDMTDMRHWTETRAILTHDPISGVITVTPDDPSEAPRHILGAPLDTRVAMSFTIGTPLADAANTIHFDPPLLLSSVPLTAEQQGLLELAEGIADGLESDALVLVDEQRDHDEAMNAVMFLSFDEAEFMEQVCRFDGLVVKPWDDDALDMAAHLEAGGLVTIDRSQVGYVIVSAVRPDGDEQ